MVVGRCWCGGVGVRVSVCAFKNAPVCAFKHARVFQTCRRFEGRHRDFARHTWGGSQCTHISRHTKHRKTRQRTPTTHSTHTSTCTNTQNTHNTHHHHQGLERSLHAGAPGNCNHDIWKPRFACVRVDGCSGDYATVSLLHASAVGCARLGCAVISLMMCKCFFFQAVVGLHASPRFSTVGSLSPCQQIPGARNTADRQATCQVASTQPSTPKTESTKVFASLAAELAMVVVWTRKSCLWDHSNLVGRTPKQQCEDPPPRPV